MIELENLRPWVTNVYYGRYFNNVVRQKIKQDILKRVIINGETGSSWHFKCFNNIQVNVILVVICNRIYSARSR